MDHMMSVPVCPGEVVLLKGLPSRCTGIGACSILVFDEGNDADWIVKQVDGCVLEYDGFVQCDRVLSAWRPTGFKDLTEVDGDAVLRELFGDASGGSGDDAAARAVHQARLRVWRRDSGAGQQQQHVSGSGPVQEAAAATGQAGAAGEAVLHEAVRQVLRQQPAAASSSPAAAKAAAVDAAQPDAVVPVQQQQQPSDVAAARERPPRRSRRSGGGGGSCSTTSAAASTASVSEAGTPTAVRSASDLPSLAAAEAVGEAQQRVQQQPRQLYVSNLSFRTTEAGLAELFGHHGRVTSIKVPGASGGGGGGGGCRGYGFVTFARPEDAAAALRTLDGATVEGRVIKVVVSHTTRPQSGSSSSRARARKAAAAAKQQPAATATPATA